MRKQLVIVVAAVLAALGAAPEVIAEETCTTKSLRDLLDEIEGTKPSPKPEPRPHKPLIRNRTPLGNRLIKIVADDQLAAIVDASSFRNVPELPDNLRFATLAIVPENSSEFTAVFGRIATQSDLKTVSHARTELSRSVKNRSFVRSEADVVEGIRSSSANVIAIMGHNEGGLLRLADGSVVPISSLAEKCRAAGKFCVVLSCRSSTYLPTTERAWSAGLDSVITYEQATRILSRFEQEAAAFKGRDLRASMQPLLRAVERETKRRVQLKFIVTGAGTAIVVVGVLLAISDDE